MERSPGRHCIGNLTLDHSPVHTPTETAPNMSLAKELLERGEKEVVLRYLDLCKSFWTSSRGQPDRWIDEIKAGKIPDFGPNLNY